LGSGRNGWGDWQGRTIPVYVYVLWVNWDGNALVFENESHSERVAPATWNERREVWSLDETGRLQIVITNRGWDGPARRLMLLYRRP